MLKVQFSNKQHNRLQEMCSSVEKVIDLYIDFDIFYLYVKQKDKRVAGEQTRTSIITDSTN